MVLGGEIYFLLGKNDPKTNPTEKGLTLTYKEKGQSPNNGPENRVSIE